MKKEILMCTGIIISVIGLTSCSSVSRPNAKPSTEPSSHSTMAIWNGNTNAVWEKLLHTSSTKLVALQNTANDPAQHAWIQLALISKRNSTNTQHLANELLVWREHNPSHPANQLIPDNAVLIQLLKTQQPKQVAILIPQRGSFGSAGKTVREGFLNAYFNNLAKSGKQTVKFYDTTQAPNITAAYQQATRDGADFIVGPLLKQDVQDLSMSNTINTTTLALNYADGRYGSSQAHFYQFGLMPEDEISQIADRAHEAGLRRAIIIAPQNAWGNRLVAAFSSRWHALGGSIFDRFYFTPQSDFNERIASLMNVDPVNDNKLMRKDNNKLVLQQQRRQDFDVIFVFAQSKQAHTILPLLKYYYAGNTPIYASSTIYTGKQNQMADVDLSGVIICDIPWNIRMTQNAGGDKVQTDRLYAVGQDAYLLSQSLERLTQLPNFPIYGTTGALRLSSSHQIHRSLPCHTM